MKIHIFNINLEVHQVKSGHMACMIISREKYTSTDSNCSGAIDMTLRHDPNCGGAIEVGALWRGPKT